VPTFFQANNAILHYFMVGFKTFLAEWWLFCVVVAADQYQLAGEEYGEGLVS
jgi:hypothetical protein